MDRAADADAVRYRTVLPRDIDTEKAQAIHEGGDPGDSPPEDKAGDPAAADPRVDALKKEAAGRGEDPGPRSA